MGVNYSKTALDYRGSTYKDLLEHFLSTALSTNKGKLLIFLWTSGLIGSFSWGVFQKRNRSLGFKEHSKEKNAEKPVAEKKPPGLIQQLKDILPLAFPSIWNKSSMYLSSYTVLLVLRILLTIQVGNVTFPF
jgi:hypothetical protein